MSSRDHCRIAIYADVNPNIIDGSSVWLRNVARLATASAADEVDLLLKAPIVRHELMRDLAHEGLNSVPPPTMELTSDGILPSSKVGAWTVHMHSQRSYAAIIVRGWLAARAMAACPELNGLLWVYLTDVPQRAEDIQADFVGELRDLVDASRHMLLQTEELRSHLEQLLLRGHSKLALLPPLVPDEAFVDRAPPVEAVILGYAGKFAPDWAIDELLDVHASLRVENDRSLLHVVGDKFHRVADDRGFARRLQRRLTDSAGVRWYGGLSQSDTLHLMSQWDVGYGMRRSALDSSLELSTKILEYGASGAPALINPTPMHRRILGNDYALFASDADSAVRVLKGISTMDLAKAAAKCKAVAERHRASAFQHTFDDLLGMSWYLPSSPSRRSRPVRVALAGHDLQFCDTLVSSLRARADVELKLDHWRSLREHDEDASMSLLKWADIVICERCAGNAVWYSQRMAAAEARLLVRFDHSDLKSAIPSSLDAQGVYRMVFVNGYDNSEAISRFGFDPAICEVIPAPLDIDLYRRPKLDGDRFHIGLIGYVPKLKRLDRALDVLAELRTVDRRYQLFVKGDHPWDCPQIWRREEEREYYEACFRRLREDERLRGAVTFDIVGEDIARWLRKIGFVLSVSDDDGWDTSAVEGVASGALPLIHGTEGARATFGADLVHEGAVEIAAFCRVLGADRQRASEIRELAAARIQPFSVEIVRSRWDALFE